MAPESPTTGLGGAEEPRHQRPQPSHAERFPSPVRPVGGFSGAGEGGRPRPGCLGGRVGHVLSMPGAGTKPGTKTPRAVESV
jgi:hypothetical protein